MPTTEEVLDRLEILRRKLEDEGVYVGANTAWLASEEIKRLWVPRIQVIEECVREAHKFIPDNSNYALGTLVAVEGICNKLRAMAAQ